MRTVEECLQGMNETEFLYRVSRPDGFGFFCERVLGLELSDFHHEWIELLQNKNLNRLCVMAPRQHGKSTIWGVAFVLWKLLTEKGKTILVVSSSDLQATKILERIKDQIMNNEILEKLKPDDYREAWSAREIKAGRKKLSNHVISSTLGPRIRGLTIDYVICDDLLRDDNILTPDQVKDRFFEIVVPTTSFTEGRVIVIGTPQSHTDLLHELKDLAEKGIKWTFMKYAAIIDDEKKIVLWPEHYSYEKLMATKREVGALRFIREYLCEPITDEISLFPYSNLQNSFDESASFINIPSDKRKRYIIGVDLARSGKASADYSVYTTVELDEHYNKRIVRIERYKGVETQTQIDRIEQLSRIFNNAHVLVEKNNIGTTFLDYLSKKGVFVDAFVTTRSTREDLIRYLVNQFENGKIIIPRRGDNTTYLIDLLVSELMAFGVGKTRMGRERFESSAAHDDMVFSLALAVLAARDRPREMITFHREHGGSVRPGIISNKKNL